jgi:hypothetical protein
MGWRVAIPSGLGTQSRQLRLIGAGAKNRHYSAEECDGWSADGSIGGWSLQLQNNSCPKYSRPGAHRRVWLGSESVRAGVWLWADAISTTCWDWGGTSIAWMSGKTSKRQGGPARFSKQPSIWHRVEAGVDKWGAGGQGGMCDWPTGVELDGRGPPAHCIHPGRTHDGPRSFAALSSSHMVSGGVHLPHALGSRYEACRASPIKGRGRCVPAHTVQPGNSPYEVPPHRIWP